MKNKHIHRKTRNQRGFTLLELLVVIAVIGVLASLAVPRFQNQLRKARFVEVVNAAAPYKTGVELCYQRNVSLVNCNTGNNGVPPALTAANGVVASVEVASGTITATGTADVGAETYVITPTPTVDQGLTWAQRGTCRAKNLCEP
ncbi:MAG: pilin [Formosimonas sp.]